MPPQLQVACASDTGQVREHNEDCIGRPPPESDVETARRQRGDLYIVADGIGGYVGGATASTMAVQEILDAYYGDTNPDLVQSLRQAIQQANTAIRQRAARSEKLSKMGTTVVAALVQKDQITFANVGDSRAYIIPGAGQIRQITEDHSWVAEQVKMGLLPPSQAEGHPYRSVITRSLGQKEQVDVDFFGPLQLETGEVVLLCSDGLTNLVSDDEIAPIVQQLPLQQAAERLIELANERGGTDNATVVLLRRRPEAL